MRVLPGANGPYYHIIVIGAPSGREALPAEALVAAGAGSNLDGVGGGGEEWVWGKEARRRNRRNKRRRRRRRKKRKRRKKRNSRKSHTSGRRRRRRRKWRKRQSRRFEGEENRESGKKSSGKDGMRQKWRRREDYVPRGLTVKHIRTTGNKSPSPNGNSAQALGSDLVTIPTVALEEKRAIMRRRKRRKRKGRRRRKRMWKRQKMRRKKKKKKRRLLKKRRKRKKRRRRRRKKNRKRKRRRKRRRKKSGKASKKRKKNQQEDRDVAWPWFCNQRAEGNQTFNLLFHFSLLLLTVWRVEFITLWLCVCYNCKSLIFFPTSPLRNYGQTTRERQSQRARLTNRIAVRSYKRRCEDDKSPKMVSVHESSSPPSSSSSSSCPSVSGLTCSFPFRSEAGGIPIDGCVHQFQPPLTTTTEVGNVPLPSPPWCAVEVCHLFLV